MVTDFLILLLLGLEVAVLSRLDRQLFGTWVTPFNVLAYPYAAVILLCYLFSPALDFVPLYVPSVLIWIAGLFILWAIGAFLGWCILDVRGEAPHDPAGADGRGDTSVGTARLAMRVGWATIFIMLFGLVYSARQAGGWSWIGSPEFKDAYSRGLHGHAAVLASLVSVALIGLYRRGKRLEFLTILLLLSFIGLSQVKGHILPVIFGGLLFRVIYGKMRLGLKQTAAALAATYVLFNLIYAVGTFIFFPDRASDSSTYSFFARHYCYYLFSGPLSLGESIRSGANDVGGNWSMIFAPFIDLYRVVFNAGAVLQIGSSHAKGMVVDLLNKDTGDNVYTFFGTLYLYLGAAGAAAYVVGVGVITYSLLACVTRRSETWLTSAYCYLLGNLAVGFFEFYFWHLDCYEVVAASLIFAYFLQPQRSVVRPYNSNTRAAYVRATL
jgi:hypothetical protein